jgi:ABC-type cobalamin/Fe3+-siderophores transport system ATPase subunit
MNLDLTIKNYRCFPDSNPARLSVRKGFTGFVGPNNSGKSALLRFFYEFRELFSRVSGDPLGALHGRNVAFNLAGVSDITAVFSNDNRRSISIEIDFLPSSQDQAPAGPDLLPTRLVIEVLRDQNVYRILEFHTAVGSLGTNSEHVISTSEIGRFLVFREASQRRAYLEPALTALASLARTTYLGAFRNAINVGGSQNYFDILVGEQFLRAWRQLKTGTSRQQASAFFRLTDNIRQIFGFNQMEINTSDDNKNLQVFVDGKPFWLDELGSGIAQFILVLASLATREQAYILVDEPELNLHPSLQIDFVTTIGSYASEGVLFGTHSIGLARAVGQQVYALKRLREGVSDMQPLEGIPRLAEFLGELSFSGYRELGFERVLLVEGPHDVTTVQQFLRKRNLDHKIVVLPLGGSSMINCNREIELAETQRISPDLHVLIDSERNAEGKELSGDRRAFMGSCEKLGIRCHVLVRRAMENYFSDRAIKAVKTEKYRALAPFENLKDAAPAWAKSENWRIAREMTLDELKGTDLGAFVASL